MNILLVEDNEAIIRGLEYAFVSHNYGFCAAETVAQAKAYLQNQRPDLLILDITLPDGNGLLLYRDTIQKYGIPTIFLTAQDDEETIVEGLNLGAEDNITKPFEMLELLARIQTVLRRVGKNAKRFCWRGLQVDLASHTVVLNGAPVDLTPQEYSLLETLLLNRNIALSRERLLESAWGYDYMGETRTVDNHILRLRKKLGLEKEIQTVYKLGYRLALPEE